MATLSGTVSVPSLTPCNAMSQEDEKSTARYLNDLHIFNTTTMTWSSPKVRARPRRRGCMWRPAVLHPP